MRKMQAMPNYLRRIKLALKAFVGIKPAKNSLFKLVAKASLYGGIYDNLEDAKYAAFKLRQDLHGKFANHG